MSLKIHCIYISYSLIRSIICNLKLFYNSRFIISNFCWIPIKRQFHYLQNDYSTLLILFKYRFKEELLNSMPEVLKIFEVALVTHFVSHL